MRKAILVLTCLLISPWLHAEAFTLQSADIAANGQIALAQVFNGFGCKGQNISPALSWQHPPSGSKSFALLVHDPDAPTGGSGWWHWLVVNIPAHIHALPTDAGQGDGANMVDAATQIKTDFGTAGWGGPCPPVGDKPHRYIFSLHALNTEKLEVPQGATAALVGYLVNAASIAKATFTAYYGR